MRCFARQSVKAVVPLAWASGNSTTVKDRRPAPIGRAFLKLALIGRSPRSRKSFCADIISLFKLDKFGENLLVIRSAYRVCGALVAFVAGAYVFYNFLYYQSFPSYRGVLSVCQRDSDSAEAWSAFHDFLAKAATEAPQIYLDVSIRHDCDASTDAEHVDIGRGAWRIEQVEGQSIKVEYGISPSFLGRATPETWAKYNALMYDNGLSFIFVVPKEVDTTTINVIVDNEGLEGNFEGVYQVTSKGFDMYRDFTIRGVEALDEAELRRLSCARSTGSRISAGLYCPILYPSWP